MKRLAPLVFLVPTWLAAQGNQRCTLTAEPQTSVKTATGNYNTFGRNVTIRCPVSQLTIRSDSVEFYPDEGRYFFVGNARYSEPRFEVDSDFLTYYQNDERIVANGNVNARMPNGSTMRGPFAEYFRAIPGRRPLARLNATGRPTVTVAQRDSLGRAQEPMTVVARNITMVGDSLVYAAGLVVASRSDVQAQGDSMDLDSAREIAVMLRDPSIQGKGERPFTLIGDRIELMSRERRLARVLAKGKGRAVSNDLVLTSDTIDLRVANDLLQRAIAWGASRARATSTTQSIVADSLDVVMPGQRLSQVHAVGVAAAEGQPDSTRFRADTVDWLRGDTIVAHFDTAAAGDTSRTTRLRQLVATGGAKSWYHVAPADTSIKRPAISYATGREIVVAFSQGRVAKVTVIEQATGVYAEPRPESPPRTAAPAPVPVSGVARPPR